MKGVGEVVWAQGFGIKGLGLLVLWGGMGLGLSSVGASTFLGSSNFQLNMLKGVEG